MNLIRWFLRLFYLFDYLIDVCRMNAYLNYDLDDIMNTTRGRQDVGSSDSGRSKFLLKRAGPSHHQTSVSIHQTKAFYELYSTVRPLQ